MVTAAGGWPNLWGLFTAPAAGRSAIPPVPPSVAPPARSPSPSTLYNTAGDGVATSPPPPQTLPPGGQVVGPLVAPLGFMADGDAGRDRASAASPSPHSPSAAGEGVPKRARVVSPVDVRGEAGRPPPAAAMTDMVATVLDRVAAANSAAAAANLPAWQEEISAFYSVSVPDLSTASYVARLVTYCKASSAVLIVSLVLLDRLGTGPGSDPRLRVNGYNLHRLLVTAVMLACKSVEDRTFSAAHFAIIGGVDGAAEMAKLERLMLAALDWRVVVGGEMLALYESRLRQRYCALGGDAPTSFLAIEA